MNEPPALAMAILRRLGPQQDALAGDLLEEYAAGRSKRWFYRQVLSAVTFAAIRDVRRRPLRAVAAIAMGWTVLLLGFTLLGDRTAGGLAAVLWKWDRQSAYETRVWWPFHLSAVFVSYAGFALSAWVVARVYRRTPAMLLAFWISVLITLPTAAVVLEVLFRRWGGVAVPHGLFYVVSVTLPYQWRSGLLLVPVIVLLSGIVARGRLDSPDAPRIGGV